MGGKEAGHACAAAGGEAPEGTRSLVARALHCIFDAMKAGGVPDLGRSQEFIIVAGQRPDDLAAIVDPYVEAVRASAPEGRSPVWVIDSMDIVRANPIPPGQSWPLVLNMEQAYRGFRKGATVLAFVRGYEEAAGFSRALKGQELEPAASRALTLTASLGCQELVHAVHVCSTESRARLFSVEMFGTPVRDVRVFRERDAETGGSRPEADGGDLRLVEALRRFGRPGGEAAAYRGADDAWTEAGDAAEMVQGMGRSGSWAEGLVRDASDAGDAGRLHAFIRYDEPLR